MDVSEEEVAKFDNLAHEWWDPKGAFRSLHLLNPLRLAFIKARAALPSAPTLDVGCGGGLLSEGLCQLGAKVTGIDASQDAITVARIHAEHHGLPIHYHRYTAEGFLAENNERLASFKVVCALELLEHVPDPVATLKTISALAAPGADVFLSTINRTPKAFFLGIVAAEYILNFVPKGTHQYAHFIRPSELIAWGKQADLSLLKLQGVTYHPLRQTFSLSDDVAINYMVHFRKGE